MKIFHLFGEYILLLVKVFTKPERGKIYYSLIVKEIDKLGIQSIGIVAIISAFMGGNYTTNCL